MPLLEPLYKSLRAFLNSKRTGLVFNSYFFSMKDEPFNNTLIYSLPSANTFISLV